MRLDDHRYASALAAAALAAVLACSGSTGPAGASGAPGTPAVDHGSIVGTVKDPNGSPVASATVSTDPATTTALTDGASAFTLASIPVGAYTVVASMAGYVDGRLAVVGVGAGASVRVSLVLAPVPPTAGSLSGVVRGRKGTTGASVAVAGAQVCVEGSTNCTTSGADGSYALSGVAPGFAFASASAAGFLPGESRAATFVAAGATANVDVTLSGRPPDSATYVGSDTCVACHRIRNADLVAAWQASAHALAVDRSTGRIDVTGWPAAGDCTAPRVKDSTVQAADPADGASRDVFLVRWGASCGAGKPAFAMAFDTNGDGSIDAPDTVMPVTGSAGGVATGAGQCGNGGILPANTPCSANLGGTGATAAAGWWQQEYLGDFGGAAPSWASWLVAGDALVLPLAWNQRTGQWIGAPDYNTAQGGSFAQACAGCHDTGLTLAVDASGFVSRYAGVEPRIGCEKCHGPGSSHVDAGGDAQLVVSPAYLTAQSEREVCGQCHSQGVASKSPVDASGNGVFGFAWNDAATVGGGNFIPGVHLLSDFETAPSYGDPDFYYPSGFPSSDHETYTDLGATVHANNAYEKLTCSSCHSGHAGAGGPASFQRSDDTSGFRYVFTGNGATLRNDVVCLACHAGFGPFAAVTAAQVAGYHVEGGGAARQIDATGTSTAVAPDAAATSAVASAVSAHMLSAAAMPAYFDPTGAVSGMPVGRCSSCHMAKTAATAVMYTAPMAGGRTADVIGDVTAHTFQVAWPDMSIATLGMDTPMPNVCGSCHSTYLVGR